jgi:hypothetical protein
LFFELLGGVTKFCPLSVICSFRVPENVESDVPEFTAPVLRPVVAVERAVVDSFADVRGIDVLASGEVGDGAGNF